MITLAILVSLALPAQKPPLALVRTIPLPGVEGRIDHMAVDARGQRLFVCALGNNTVEVVDLKAGRVVHTIRGLHEPQGCAYAADVKRLFVANGQGEGCDVFDGATFAKLKTTRFGDDSDNVRYDSANREVAVGYGSGALAFVDASTTREPSTISLAAHPESFQLESSGPRVFVNVPNAEQIAVIDRQKRTVVAHWPLKEAKSNFPMALDEPNHRLIVGCRRPARALVFDTASGRQVESFDIVGDADDLWVDHKRHRLYAVGGEGFVDVFAENGGRHTRLARIATAAGARTAFFSSELDLLCVAVPHRGSQRTEIRVYQPE